MAGKERWQTQDEEEEHRRALLKRASKGDAKAQEALMETYGVRLYSEREKAQLVYDAPAPRRRAAKERGVTNK